MNKDELPESASRAITNCQICDHEELSPVVFLGYVPPVNAMRDAGAPLGEELAFPLEMVRCTSCGLVQIGTEVDPSVLFPHSYPYLSGTTRILRENFAALYGSVAAHVGLTPDDLVVDIGSNDGTLLSNFAEGHRVLGIEPSQAGDLANERGIETWITYFGAATAKRVVSEHGRAKVVTATNVFAHIPDPHGIVDAIVSMLDDDGVFVSENHYLLDLVQTVQYDTIYHEHLRYYSLDALTKLFEPHGLEVFHVERIPTHGGSIRVFTARKGTKPIQASVAERLADERSAGIVDGSGFEHFAARIKSSKVELYALLAPLVADGARIFGVGAPSRASTLVTYTGLDDGIVSCVVEVPGSHKIGKYMPGTRIPVLDEEVLYRTQPDYALLLSWHISEDLVRNLRKRGYRGKFIVPLPEPRILDV